MRAFPSKLGLALVGAAVVWTGAATSVPAQDEVISPEEIGIYDPGDPRRRLLEDYDRDRRDRAGQTDDVACSLGFSATRNYWSCERVMPVPRARPSSNTWNYEGVMPYPQ